MNTNSREHSAPQGSPLRAWIAALRIGHWTKNFFVLAPFLMGPRFGWNEYLWRSLAGAGLFALTSSAIYLFNDILDLNADRLHPKKRFRPLAAGRVSVTEATTVAIALVVVSLGLSVLLDVRFFLVLLAYCINNIAYTLFLKSKTVVDVMSIALGFVLRVFAGGYVIDIVITDWLVASVFTLSLLIGFGKRRGEFGEVSADAGTVRAVLRSYSIPKLDLLLGVSCAVTIVTYMLYTMAPETRLLHGTDNLIYTTPFVAYCVFRYLLKVQEPGGGDPVEVILRDRGFSAAGVAWLGLFLYLTR